MSMSKLPVVVVAVAAFAFCGARGDDLNITSFGGNGELVFNEVENATNYRVEWAPSPAGPWTNSWEHLKNIIATGSGSVTCSVAMCYRVVAEGDFPPEGMVRIPGGTNSGTDPDYGAYSLTVGAFYMDATEVTKAQWDVVYSWAITNGYSFAYAGLGKASSHPVHTVSWYDCVKWCNARSQKEGRTPCYNLSTWACNFSANGYRLPTNDEWEYAARGGLSGKRFPWGDSINHNYANYKANGAAYSYDTSPYTIYTYHPDYDEGGSPYTSPAGAFAANGYGLYDMAGNVWEWCNDTSGSLWSSRGGGWRSDASPLQCGYEYWTLPDYAINALGFRSACR